MRTLIVISCAIAATVSAAAVGINLQQRHELLNDAFDAGRNIGQVEGIRDLQCSNVGGDWCEKATRIQPYVDCFHQHAPDIGQCETLIR